MPLAFLVKRKKYHNVYKTYRPKTASEDDKSDSGSEQENLYTSQPHGSPDSGYSTHSPLSLTFKEEKARNLLSNYNNDALTATDLRITSKRVADENEAIKEEKAIKDKVNNIYNSVIREHINSPTIRSEKINHTIKTEMGMKIPFFTNKNNSHLLYGHHFGFNNNPDSYLQRNSGMHDKLHHHYDGMNPLPLTILESHKARRLEEHERAEDLMITDHTRPESTCSSSSRSSPVSRVETPTPQSQGSPFYFTNFDRLSVSSPHNRNSINTSPFPAFHPPTPKAPSTPGTPASPNRKRSSPSKDQHDITGKTKVPPKKTKAMRKIKFDLEDKSSPVSGTFIRDDDDMEVDGATVVCGDIDGSLNMVEITPEARQELDKIENKIGDYICQLCKEFFADAFLLASHKCSRIVHIEYRCPECDKVFNCPANLASHRRWHKPRPNNTNKNSNSNTKSDNNSNKMQETNGQKRSLDGQSILDAPNTIHRQTPSPGSESTEGLFECDQCGKKFKRQAYLKKHMANHGDDKPYPCQFCGKVLRSETARAKHVLQHAVGNKDFACEVCGNCFPNKPTLDRHARMHTSEVYTCKYCSSTFYSSPGLTRHINKCHPSENRQVILLQMPVNRPC